MPVFSDLTTWRKRYAVDGWLFILKPRIVLACQVDLPGGVATYPITSVNIKNVTDGDIADVKPGMTIAFGSAAGRQDFGRQRVRSTNDPTITIGWSSPGYEIGAVTIEDDAYITVWELYEAWMKPPYIDKSSGNMFKDKDITLGTNGTQPPPICNSGPGFFIRGTRGGYANGDVYSVTFNGSLSIAVDPDASIDSHDWSFGPSASPTTSNDANPTVDMPYGFSYVEHTVYDTNGNTATQHIPVFIGDQDETASRGTLSFFEGFRVSQRSLKPEGQTFAVEMYEDVDWNDFPDGTLVAYIEDEYYDEVLGSLAGPEEREHIKFIGWMDNESLRLTGRPPSTYETRATFNCVDIGGRLAKLPGFPQELHRKASPSNWLEADKPDLHWWLHYLLHWHSTVLTVADYRPDQSIVSNYPFSTLGSGGTNLYDQTDERAKAVNSRLTCDQRGTLYVKGDPGIQITYNQSLLPALAGVPYRTQTEIMTIGPDDHSDFTVNLTRPPKYHWFKGSALEISRVEFGTGNLRARFCISPGPAPGQGASAAERTQRLIINIDELLYTHGHEYAMRYNPPHGPITLTLTHPGDCGLEPAFMEWVVVDTDTDKFLRPLPFDSRRYLIKQVDFQYNHEAHTRQVNLTLEREVLGQPATEIVYEDNEMGLTVYERPDEGDVYVITEEQEENCTTFDYRLPARVLIYAGSYKFFRCRNFNTPDPADRTWEYLDFSGLSWPNSNTGLATIMADPHNNDAVLFWGNHAVGISEDFWVNDSPTMDVLAAIDDGTSGDSFSLACDASVNRVDWFGWASSNRTYAPGGGATANNAFYWTDDRFATIHRVALPQVTAVGSGNADDTVDIPWSMDIGHFNTSSVGKIWMACNSGSSNGSDEYNEGRVLRSDDWGATWIIETEDAPASLNSTPSAGRSQAIMPHTLPGGAKNKSYKNLSRFYWSNVFRTPRNTLVTQNPSGFGWSGNALRHWTINPYNGKYFAGVVASSTAKGFFYSKDGGTNIDYYQPVTTLSSIGWWWPNPKFYIISGNDVSSNRQFWYTVDGGANWTDFSGEVQDAADAESVSLLATSMIVLTDDPLIDEFTCITQVTVTE